MILILLGLVQLAVALLLAVLTAYLGIYLFEWTTRTINEWAELRRGNVSIGVVLGAIVVALALLLRPVTQVSITNWDVGQGLLPVYVLLAEAVQILVGLILAVASIWLALFLFSRLTGQIDEMEELKKDNRAIAALLAGVILVVALLISTSVQNLTSIISALLIK